MWCGLMLDNIAFSTTNDQNLNLMNDNPNPAIKCQQWCVYGEYFQNIQVQDIKGSLNTDSFYDACLSVRQIATIQRAPLSSYMKLYWRDQVFVVEIEA